MEDRCTFFDSTTYGDDGIEKRENLKANSPGSSESFTGSRTSFFLRPFLSSNYFPENLQQQDLLFVAEPAEIPIFRNLNCLNRQEDSIIKAVKVPSFFNST